MSIHKYVRFAAPYRSKTFNDKDALVVGRNGVLSGGEVTQSGDIVTIQPITFIQNGQVVDVTVPLSSPEPLQMLPPYFIVLSVSSSVESQDEALTPTYVKRPQDITSDLVLVAEYDGVEWISLPKIQLQAQADAAEARAYATGDLGIAQGFDLTQDTTKIYVAPGTLIDVNGRLVQKSHTTTLTKTAAPSYPSMSRVDSIVYRKPQDNKNRVGQIKYITGPTFYEGGGYNKEHKVFDDATYNTIYEQHVTSGAKTLVSHTYNRIASIINIDGTLKLSAYDGSFALLNSIELGGQAIDFDFCINPEGDYEVVYTDNNGYKLNYVKVYKNGNDCTSTTYLITSTYVHSKPQIECASYQGSYRCHITVLKQMNSVNSTVHYTSVDASGSILTPDTLLLDLTTNLTYQNIAVNDDDSLIYMALQDDGTGKCYLYTWDVSLVDTATAPFMSATPIELQNDVLGYTQVQAPQSGATQPVVFITDTKDVFVVWKHFLGSGAYGLAIYNKKFMSQYGHKALIVTNDNIGSFSCDIDDLNNLYYCSTDTSVTDTATLNVVDLNTLTPTLSYSFAAGTSGANYLDCNVVFCPRGELLFNYSVDLSMRRQGWTLPAGYERTQREATGALTDTNIGNLSRPDDELYTSGLIVEETLAVRRIYELMSMCVATGTVNWAKSGASKLDIVSPIALKFFNKDCTLTIPASTITVPDGYSVAVSIPDEDANATLSASVVKFGEGLLDREGRKQLIIFWNIGGILYSRFAPFRLTADGETIILGDSVSQDMLNWLGAEDSSPNYNNHNYSSITYIVQSDSHNTAIGKLDQALTDYSNAGFANVVPLSSGSTSVSVVFPATRATASYRLGLALENLVDSYPMMVPYIVTAKSTTGFTVTWTDPLDTANYALNFVLRNTV